MTIAIWVGSKPPMDILFAPLQKVVAGLSEPSGLTVQLPEGPKTFTVHLLFGVFDLIVKAPALNIHQHNGFYGCSVCLHPGETFCHRMVYASGVHRTHEMYIADALSSGTVVNGVK